jgi:hypothetical protein
MADSTKGMRRLNRCCVLASRQPQNLTVGPSRDHIDRLHLDLKLLEGRRDLNGIHNWDSN